MLALEIVFRFGIIVNSALVTMFCGGSGPGPPPRNLQIFSGNLRWKSNKVRVCFDQLFKRGGTDVIFWPFSKPPNFFLAL